MGWGSRAGADQGTRAQRYAHLAVREIYAEFKRETDIRDTVMIVVGHGGRERGV